MEHKALCLLKRAQLFLPVKKKAKASKFEIICTPHSLPPLLIICPILVGWVMTTGLLVTIIFLTCLVTTFPHNTA